MALVCKAYNGRVVMQWLAETIAEAAQQESYVAADDRMPLVAVTMLLVVVDQLVCRPSDINI